MEKSKSVLLDWQRQKLKIEQFIFHIIAQPNEDGFTDVIFLDEVQVTQRQKEFFQDRLKEVAEGNKYRFLDENDHLRKKCKEIDGNFVKVSREIARSFSSHHGRKMSPGLFIVSEVSVPLVNNNKGRLVFLIKLDNKKTLNISYKDVNGKKVADLQDVLYALSENKSAVQKSALIDVDDYFEWDVLAYDRNGPERSTKLSRFFEGFLGVGIYGSPQSLTAETYKTVNKWYKRLDSEYVPKGLTKVDVKQRVLQHINGNLEFKTDDFINAIIRDDDSENIELITYLRDNLKKTLQEVGIAGQKFLFDQKNLTKKQRQVKYITDEGIEIILTDGAGRSTIKVDWESRNHSQTGPAVIRIKTSNLRVESYD